jgi:hypothetical protein
MMTRKEVTRQMTHMNAPKHDSKYRTGDRRDVTEGKGAIAFGSQVLSEPGR